jgi:dolichyl-phosphate-mannose--protein O-mannosyl transferase
MLLALVVIGGFAIVDIWAAFLEMYNPTDQWIPFISKEFCSFMALFLVAYFAQQIHSLLPLKKRRRVTKK